MHNLILIFVLATAAHEHTGSYAIPPSSPTSNILGLHFDRFVTIWLENTDYNQAASDRLCPRLATHTASSANHGAQQTSNG